jgi:hypothetical protein
MLVVPAGRFESALLLSLEIPEHFSARSADIHAHQICVKRGPLRVCCALAADLQESMRRAFANVSQGALE